jgi:hypothetical protein
MFPKETTTRHCGSPRALRCASSNWSVWPEADFLRRKYIAASLGGGVAENNQQRPETSFIVPTNVDFPKRTQ